MNILKRYRHVALGLLLPLTLCAQAGTDYPLPESAAPADVTAALRERVDLFFSYHIGSVNRRALDLVAENTKDFYFSSGKVLFLKVAITSINFSKDMKKAAVQLETTQNWQVAAYTTVATTPVVTTWMIENGQWFWFLDQQAANRSITPMGVSTPPVPGQKLAAVPFTNPDGTLNLPKDFAEPERVAAQGMAILSLSSLDKNTVTITSGKPSSDQIKFHNGLNGQISVKLYDVPDIPGLTVKLDKSDLGPNEDTIVRFDYEVSAKPIPDVLLRSFNIILALIPLGQEYPIKLSLQLGR